MAVKDYIVPPDYRLVGCALCGRFIGEGGSLPYQLPPPWGSLDARVDVRLDPGCYRQITNAIRALVGVPPVPGSYS
jgi:hypothetical protein